MYARSRDSVSSRPKFGIGTLRGLQQPELSRKLNRLIKNENGVISAHEKAARERVSIASQLSEWGDSTEDEAVSDIADKLGVMLAEVGEQEDIYAQNLEDSRGLLKHIRETEKSVQPARDHRAKVADDIQKLKWKDPNSPKLETLEQELVRAEAQSLVAEAQLTNMTRQKLKEAYDVHLAAVIERGEKQIILARHARHLLNLLDDTPVVPGDARREYDRGAEAKQVLEDAEKDLLTWESTVVPIQTSAAQMQSGALPAIHPTRDAEHEADGTTFSDTTREIDGSAADASRDLDGYVHSETPETNGYIPGETEIDEVGPATTRQVDESLTQTNIRETEDAVTEGTKETVVAQDLNGFVAEEAKAAQSTLEQAARSAAQPIAVPY
ncbi:hypothetical protein EYZ11_002779 [Aspergillus tanneri]|uniref:Eisosome core component n=1 Tax=Aspergillus tanneri TaxID=1220188 RepID=A0A4S3JQ10_9EURO|nr:uncharacterized protein ATNIH1004_008602 [Aspergillus tanneri]KAA8644398.1 hypothetical protein ATNIH1004_008602 [Aspergillus tanneri]THC97732.1 hypothetical protein EYZ11_002779 [Aspergillus tanneri]